MGDVTNWAVSEVDRFLMSVVCGLLTDPPGWAARAGIGWDVPYVETPSGPL